MGKDAGGLQASLDEVLQRQTKEFQKTVDAAQEQLDTTIKQFTEQMAKVLNTKPSTQTAQPEYEAKIIDGGLWLNKAATDALLEVIDAMGKLLDDLQRQ